MNQRIIGFDLARAFAIFGMFSVLWSKQFKHGPLETCMRLFQTIENKSKTTIWTI
jgi:uncharacterized membrane protein YeiB